jgi:hypothetical protein
MVRLWRKLATPYAMMNGDFDSEYKIAAGPLEDPRLFNWFARELGARAIVDAKLWKLE